MASWPGSLPQFPLLDSLSRGGKANLIRSEMETGEAKVRRRTTAATRPMTLAFMMTEAQFATFEAFVENTLDGGSARFDVPNPRGGSGLLTVRMAAGTGSSVYNAVAAGRYWRVDFAVEVMPT